MKLQKRNSDIVIVKRDVHQDSSKGAIEQLTDYIDSLNLPARKSIFNTVDIYGGTYTVIGTCTEANSWSTFIAFNYFSGNIFHLIRDGSGSWSSKTL